MINRILVLISIGMMMSYLAKSQTNILDKLISVDFENITIEKALDKLSNEHDITFSYSNELSALLFTVNISFEAESLNTILTKLLTDTNIRFLTYSNQIILQETKIITKALNAKGVILDDETNLPIKYATIEIKCKKLGTVANIDGEFDFELSNEYINDTLVFSSLGYEQVLLTSKTFIGTGSHTIFLSPMAYEIPEIIIKAKEIKVIQIGNTSRISMGSLYMDTHGQQTALFIKNKNKEKGKISSVNYFLSGKGNTDAPFRVRIYNIDTVTGKPDKDLLPEMIVVKPNKGRGWFSVNISKFNLELPINGFFVVMEGIFPNDYDFYINGEDYTDISIPNKDKEFAPTSISYGQRLGYNRRRGNNTWHYSLTHTWFQLKKQNYNVMISANIDIKVLQD